MNATSACRLFMVLMTYGCSSKPHPGRDIRITAEGSTLDAYPATVDSLKRCLNDDMQRFGPNCSVRISAAADAPIGKTVAHVANWGFLNMSFTAEGGMPPVAFMIRPGCILGPPVQEVSALVSPAGILATTNFPASVQGEQASSNRVRVYFRATPDTTGGTLHAIMGDWQRAGADIYWDDNIGSIPTERVTDDKSAVTDP